MTEKILLLAAIEETYTANHDLIAISDDSNYSYCYLNTLSNRLANYLMSFQVKPGDVVALYMRRSFDLLVSLLAVWKVGASYTCFDYEMPCERLHAVEEQLKPSCFITEPSLLNNINLTSPVLTCHDEALFDFDDRYSNDSKRNIDQLAYLIYTSGSTGLPKGVLITHVNLENYIYWFNNKFNITHRDVFSFSSSPAFDFAVTCVHAPLAAGARIVITTEPDFLNIQSYCDQLTKNKVTFAKWTPSYFKTVIYYAEKHKPDLSHLRYLMIAGEELLTSYVERWFAIYPSHTILNEYGPTETTVGATIKVVTRSNLNLDLKTVPIGKPIANLNLYLVNKAGDLLPQGEIGELWISGDSVGSGYYKSPELSNQKFIADPFTKEKKLLYKTGDLVKQLPDGDYLYVSRIDNQVKINGYRIELSEVEHALLEQPEVDHACVVVKELGLNDFYLTAYIVLKKGLVDFDLLKMSEKLSQYLPNFMMPKYYYEIDKIPLTPNGKVDRRSLLLEDNLLRVKNYVE